MKRYICDGIVKGATHVRNQTPCQDNKRIVEISDKIVIVAVADGHGSSKCPKIRSQKRPSFSGFNQLTFVNS